METLFETTKTGTYCVYCHINKINGKRYIGQTKHGDDPNKRWHLGKHYGKSFKADIDQFGWDNFDHYIIQNSLSAEEANELEKLNIIAFNTTDPKYGYNERIAGNTNTDQSVQKLSNTLKQSWSNPETKERRLSKNYMLKDNYVPWNKGIPMTEEYKKKCGASISKALKGHKVSDETKNKIRIANTGKNASKETKQKMSASHSSKVWVNDGNKSILIDTKDLNTYLNNGYTKGRNDLNKIWVHKDNSTKRIDINELEYYISIGYSKGRK